MRTIAIVNQKGGCGKTTCAINLAAIYAKRGLRTLLVDMDPQSHCAAGLGVPESRIEYSIGDALISDIDGRFNPDDLRWEVTRNLDLAPSTMRLAGMEAPGGGLHELPDKDKRLEKLLKRMDDRYDLCLVDCPPTIGLLAFNALRAARETLIPVETGYYSLIGAEKQWKTIQRIIERIGRPIACHMVATMYDEKSDVGKNILTTLRRRFAGQLLPTVIRLSETIREAACLGQPVIDYAPNSEAKQDFVKLADWLEQHACPARGQFTPAWEQRSFSSRQNISFHRRSVQSIAPESTPRIGGAGDRAAELVQRVQELNRRNRVSKAEGTQTQSPQMPLSISPKTTPHPVPEASPDSAIDTSSRELDHHSVEFKPEVASQDLKANEVKSQPRTRALDRRYILDLKMPIARLLPVAILCERSRETTRERTPARSESHEPPRISTFGVKLTSRGMIFTQPASSGRKISVAGDFNGWSPGVTMLKLREDSGVFQALVDMPPGKYQYRIVIDGKWQADRYNEEMQLNAYGEPNSVIVVPES